MTDPTSAPAHRDFIREIIDEDLSLGRHSQVVTRFPPEPNGYLHIGHAKSICLNFGLAAEYGGVCHLRFDDSNPTTEDEKYVESIKRDVRWLGFDWGDRLFFASDYFERVYQLAEGLIEKGLAYVDSSTEEEIRAARGTVTEAGQPTRFRSRPPKESLDLFRRMRSGEFPDGSHVLRARLDLDSPNMKMRDPLLYRIRHAHHYRTGNDWCIYPLYDFIHPLSDALEGITHSICTLEFENNRELYDWVVDNADVSAKPRQYEFARLSLTYTVMSKRKLLELVSGKHVSDWDDPRMPTLAGLRRRGVTAESLRAFAQRIGVSKHNSTVDTALFEHTLRDDLSPRSPRLMCVLDPLRVTLENWAPERVDELDAPLWPADEHQLGSRVLPLSREIYIDRSDFAVAPPKGWHRLAPGAEVRLRHAFVIRCERVIEDDTGRVTELVCSVDESPDTGRKVKGTLHWVSAAHAVAVEVRQYDRLFAAESPGATSGDPLTDLNADSLTIHRGMGEPALAELSPNAHVQLERIGFFYVDDDSRPEALVLNRVVPLKDSWSKRAPLADRARPAPPSPAPTRGAGAEPLTADAEALRASHGLSPEDARMLARSPELLAYFHDTVKASENPRAVASWLVNELPSRWRGAALAQLPFAPADLARLVSLVDERRLMTPAAKQVFAAMLEGEGGPEAIMTARGLEQSADESSLHAVVSQVLAQNSETVARYRAGNANLLGAFVGMVMRASGGKADPNRVKAVLAAKLDAS